jgi:RimJ/RimL family protein N-acetyltransferase
MPAASLIVEPVTLDGPFVRLEPLEVRHAEILAKHADMQTFQHFTNMRPDSVDAAGMARFIERLRTLPAVVPFAIVHNGTNEAVGCTTYMDIRPEHRGLEIGMTWIGHDFRGTQVNPQAKFLMLRHAFETLGCERVQLKCDARNLQSQAAISKLGAKFEGRLRKHFVLPDGYVRDTMMYSIIREEWPDVAAGLLQRLGSP